MIVTTVTIVVLAVTASAALAWRHHQWTHQMPAPLPSAIWHDHSPDAGHHATTWHSTLGIYPHGNPTQVTTHAQGYVHATDADTATNLANHDADTLMPTCCATPRMPMMASLRMSTW